MAGDVTSHVFVTLGVSVESRSTIRHPHELTTWKRSAIVIAVKEPSRSAFRTRSLDLPIEQSYVHQTSGLSTKDS